MTPTLTLCFGWVGPGRLQEENEWIHLDISCSLFSPYILLLYGLDSPCVTMATMTSVDTTEEEKRGEEESTCRPPDEQQNEAEYEERSRQLIFQNVFVFQRQQDFCPSVTSSLPVRPSFFPQRPFSCQSCLPVPQLNELVMTELWFTVVKEVCN